MKILLRYSNLRNISNELLAHHDDDQLDAQLQKATLSRAALESEGSRPAESLVLARSAHKVLVLEEGDVEDGSVRVHKLEPEHFDSETVLVVCLSSWVFPIGQNDCNSLVDKFENVDGQQVDAGSGTLELRN